MRDFGKHYFQRPHTSFHSKTLLSKEQGQAASDTAEDLGTQVQSPAREGFCEDSRAIPTIAFTIWLEFPLLVEFIWLLEFVLRSFAPLWLVLELLHTLFARFGGTFLKVLGCDFRPAFLPSFPRNGL